MNYYKVVALRGHVGAGKESTLTFAVEADSVYDAMQIVRRMPAVKHDRPNAIKSTEIITKEEFDKLRKDSAYKDCKGYRGEKE